MGKIVLRYQCGIKNLRYYYNPKYARNTSIIFLMIGGEGPEDGKWAAKPDIQYLQWAQEFGAHVFDLEHRFFGSLSAWFRSKYPEWTVGAVASSAPLNLKLDFYEYAVAVEEDLNITNVNCAGFVAQAFDQMQNLTGSMDGLIELNKYFKYNGITGDPTTDLTVFPNSYTDMINSVNTGNLTVLGEDNAAARGWMWLCCNEVGFMQTTEGGIFGSTVPLEYYIKMCTDMFDWSVTRMYTVSRNAAAQAYYGGCDNYMATNVVLPNGSLDPWHKLGCYENTTETMFPILINRYDPATDGPTDKPTDKPETGGSGFPITVTFFTSFLGGKKIKDPNKHP
ncbi:serine carboxypeptidase S28 [Necator americanus]|uniref:Serine carboxypeptidase S28 n=1 Tax=Necator americanus TaxID=51031 RepID=W2TBU5_NECAM|nr:serine carboxypeptidase S28 [Necator americanus]ETN79288.1 serine carboxypeptidase S28 [Necator americanus]